MFVRNKIPRYSSCPTPSSSSPSSSPPLPPLLPKATHTAEPSFLFISAKFPPHQPQPSTPPPPASLSFSLPPIPPSPRETTLYATRNLPSYTSYEAEDGSDGGSYGINKSGAHAPQLPSLLPARRRPLALSARILHPFFAAFTVTPIQPTYSAPFLSRLHTLSLFFSLSRWIDTSLLFPSRIFPLASAQPSSGSSFSVPRRFSFSVFIPIGLSPSHSFSIRLDGCPFLFCCARRRMFPSLSRYRARVDFFSLLHFAPWSFVSLFCTRGFARSSSVGSSYYAAVLHCCLFLLFWISSTISLVRIYFFETYTAFGSMCIRMEIFFRIGGVIGWGVRGYTELRWVERL